MGRTPEPVRQGAVWRSSVHHASCAPGSPSRATKDFSVYPVAPGCSTLVMMRKASPHLCRGHCCHEGVAAVALEVFDVRVVGYHVPIITNGVGILQTDQ